MILSKVYGGLMYGIIYWTNGDNEIHFVEREDMRALWASTDLKEADAKAYEIEDKWKVNCRVISLEGVSA
jgi:hypothetical protein